MPKTDFSRCLTATEAMRVPFHDVDPANIVWHGRYLKYFETVRTTLFENLDYGYDEMIESGFIWPVVDVNIRYVRPLELNQQFEVTAALAEWEMRMVVDYKVTDSNGSVLTRGRTVQVALDAKTRELYLGTPAVLQRKIEHRLKNRTP